MSKIYIVTGGASGTGLSLSHKLSKAGHRVVIWGRREDALKAAVHAGAAIDYAAGDLTDPDFVAKAADACFRTYGPFDGFVHCAGIWTPGSFSEVSAQTIVSHIQNVTIASALCLHAALRLVAKDGGRIVQIAAASAKSGFPDTALNTLAKRAQDGLNEGLIRELKGSHIRVTTVYPDSIGPADGDAVAAGDAISYADLADVLGFVLDAPASAHIQEVILTAPNSAR